jgi:amicyanin
VKRSYVIAAAAVIVVLIVVVAAAALLMNQPGGNDQNNSPGSSSSGGSSVNIINLAFDPTPLTVTVGTTVTWTNNDSVEHTVTSTSGPASFDSGRMMKGDTFSFTFDQAGTYDYFCTIHPFMRAQVIVTA